MKSKWHSYEDARKFAHSLKLKSKSEWNSFCKSGKKPDNIPATPAVVYKNDWKGMGDWLGTGRKSFKHKELWDFEKAREYVRELKISNQTKWYEFCKSGKKLEYVPSNPDKAYPKQWMGYNDWLGNKNSIQKKNKDYLSFKEAKEESRKLAKKYNIKNSVDWVNATNQGLIPKNIPNRPWVVYRKKRRKNEK